MRRKRCPVVCALAMLSIFAVVPACRKHAVAANPAADCISRTTTIAGQPEVSPSDLNTIKGLFAANNLDPTLFRFTSFVSDVYADSTKTPGTQVTAIPLVNGLPVFGSSEVFIFVASDLDTSFLNSAKPSSADSSGHQSLEDLRSLFLQHVAESTFRTSVGSNTGNPDQVKDSCLRATLGYLDAGSVPGHTTGFGISLTKVWSVSPYSTNFPAVYIDDSTGAAWGQTFLAP